MAVGGRAATQWHWSFSHAAVVTGNQAVAETEKRTNATQARSRKSAQGSSFASHGAGGTTPLGEHLGAFSSLGISPGPAGVQNGPFWFWGVVFFVCVFVYFCCCCFIPCIIYLSVYIELPILMAIDVLHVNKVSSKRISVDLPVVKHSYYREGW